MENRIDLDALEAVLTSSAPGEARLLPNGGAGLEEDWTYWGVVGGKGYYHGAGAGGFCLTGFIDKEDAQRLVASYNALPALIAELRELRAREAHMRRFAESMADDGHPILMGFAYQVQAIFGTHALPVPPAPEAQ